MKLEFPDSFLWGAATASYQIEGAVDVDGRAPSIWDTFSTTPGNVERDETGVVACDHYHRFRGDIALMKQIGLDAYRFSIAWPRIFPQGTGTTNQPGLDFYDRLVDELLAYDVQPWATLYHWDLPQAFQDSTGGWTSREIVDAFADYADVVSRRLGDRVKHWMTLNEPWVFAYMGYGSGEFAPGGKNWRDFLAAAHHALLAHAGAVQVLRVNGDRLTQVGVTLNLTQVDPGSESAEDRAAARRFDGFHNRWFLEPVFKGAYPDDMLAVYEAHLPDIRPDDLPTIGAASLDFLGINYYTRQLVADDPHAMPPLGVQTLPPPVPQEACTEMGWEIVPDSFYQMLVRVQQDYAPPAIVITENGAAFPDTLVGGRVEDPRRIAFYRDYLAALHRAIQEGVPVKGYFAWSLMDNFEWSRGYRPRFGMVYVDYPTQRRILKDSAHWFRETIKQNGFVGAESST